MNYGLHLYGHVDAIGTDKNKVLSDPANESFSAKFFLAQAGNVYSQLATGWFDQTGYRPLADSPLLSAASFSDTLLSGFDKVAYVGAFDNGIDWTANWANFDPQNTNY